MMRALSLSAAALIVAVGATNAPIARAASACDALGGNVQAGSTCHARFETSNYMIDMRFDNDYPDDQPVIDYLIRNRDAVIAAAQVPGAISLPYQIALTSDVYRSGQPTRTIPEYGQPWRGTTSLVLKNFKSIGEDAGTTYKTFSFDYDQNRPITFADLFAPGSNPMDSIYPAVATELERQFVSRRFKLPPDVGRDPAHYQSFAITDQTIIFFFNTGEFMPDEVGYFFAPVSRALLPPLQI